MELRTFIYEQNNSGGSFILNDNLRKIVFKEDYITTVLPYKDVVNRINYVIRKSKK